ncbi:5'-deoxynucleotidase [Paenibacillus thiaminolyticus]|uniref:5'-deoxynucleotidase n=1 Tax=Paenibacillus thiaminolyticus TaxID=49283 RepID=A0A3A3GHZ0_PANTH|nr:5'-deoxynucleotidase [Paenibacillus thiaminolyticus]RJG21055.1 5'-deoxynucleotidase [Paenibacillus thiaminolyticus]RJG21543.1 5'-deoxynucleotidase [Paenibacillus thiaminolyticus]
MDPIKDEAQAGRPHGHHFFAYMYRLKHIERWSLMRNTTKENVAEHSFHVAMTTHMLCTIGNEVYGKALDTGRAVMMALFHDATEVFTGDIPTPVKHHNTRILANFREIEQLAAERLIGMIPAELQTAYAPLIDQTLDEELKRYVKAADLLDAYFKCGSEAAAGNREFDVARRQTEQKLRALGLEEIDYVLTRLAPSFDMTLDEMSLPDS